MKTSSFLRLALLSAAALFTHAAFAAKPGPNPPPPPSSGMLVLDYLYPESYAKNWGLTVAPSGTIYASGITDHRGLVLASTDSGNTWIGPLDDFAPSGRDVFAWYLGGGIASDAAGNLYVAGATYDFDEIQPDQWYVRRSTDGGATWTTVDDFISGTPGYYGSRDVTGVAVDAAGDVYISGLSEVSAVKP